MDPLISGTLFAHKVIDYDYCLVPAVHSLVEACDEVVLLDCGGEDGTSELMEHLSREHPDKIKLYKAEWKSEKGKGFSWLADLCNLARLQCSGKYHVHLQADEVIHENSFQSIRRLAQQEKGVYVRRYNFWKDHRHYLKMGHVCGSTIIRCAPIECPSHGDAENLDFPGPGPSDIEFFHYGFIRDMSRLRQKSIRQEEAFLNTHNPVWDRLETDEQAIRNYYPDDQLIEFRGSHPKFAHAWLKAHGYGI